MKKLLMFLILALICIPITTDGQITNPIGYNHNIHVGDVEIWNGGLTIDYITSLNSYTQMILGEWTPHVAMTSGGSNGFYSIINPIKNLQNAYALRGRLDLRDATGAVAVNQLHAIDALTNLNATQVYTITDNLSTAGFALHGVTSADVLDVGSGDATMNVLQLMYTVQGDKDIETNGIYLVNLATSAAPYLDYGFHFTNQGITIANLYLESQNKTFTAVTNDILMVGYGNVTNGINMSSTTYSGADWILQNSETIDNIDNGVVRVTGILRSTGNMITEGDSLRISGGIIIQHDGTLPTWDHSPTGLAVEGPSEFDGKAHFDAGIQLGDNISQFFGTSEDITILWDTNSTNDDIGILRFIESDGTNIPILIVSDASFAPNNDSKFDDITEPSLGFVDDDADSYFRIGFIEDDVPGIITDGDPFTINGTEVNTQESYALANEINGILTDALAIYVWVTPTTTELDQSGEGHTATYVNVDADDWLRHGSVRSIHLETGEYATVVDHADFSFLSGVNDASVSFGGRALFHDDANVKTLMAKYDPTNNQSEWFIQCNTDEVLYISFYDEDKGAAAEGRVSDAAISAGWHDWVITYDATEQGTDASDGMAMYIDGQLIASSPEDAAGGGYVDKEDTGQMVSIGTRLDSDTAGDHWMDDMSYVWIDRSCLSAAEVFSVWSVTRRYVDMDGGIADNDIVEIDATSVADNEYARFTAYGLESLTTAELGLDLGINPENTLWVSPSGADYTTINAAITYAVTQTPAADNLWTVEVYPGIYDEAVAMAAYVDVKGVGPNGSVVIYRANATVVTLATNTTLENLTVRTGANGNLDAIIDNGVACTVTLKDITFESTYSGGGQYNPIHLSGDGTYILDNLYLHKTASTGGIGDDSFLYLDHCEAVVYVMNCDVDMRGTPPDEGEAMNMMFVITGTDIATIHSSNNRFDGDADAALCYFEAGGRMISTSDANFLVYPSQFLAGSTLLVTDDGTQASYALADEIDAILSDALFIYVWANPTTTEIDQSGENHPATYVNVDANDWLNHGSVKSLDLEDGEYLTVDDHNDFSFLSGTDDDAAVSFGGRALFYSDTNVKTLMAKYDHTNSQKEWFVQSNTDEVLYMVFHDEDKNLAAEGISTDSPIADGWHDWVITYDGTQGTSASDGMTIYIDGQVVSSSPDDATGDGYVDKENLGQMVSIGTRLDNDTSSNSWISEISYCWIEQSELSAADVFTLWSATRRYVDMDTGIANNDILEIDQTDAASGEYLRLTSYGAESRSASETRTDLGLTIDFAGMYNHNTADVIAIYLEDVFELIDGFKGNMPEAISDGDYTAHKITIGASGIYKVQYHLDFSSGAGAKQFRVNIYEVPTSNSGGTITGITIANPGVVTVTSEHGLIAGDDIKFVGIIGMDELNNNIYEVGVVDDTGPYTFEIFTQEGANVNTGAGHSAWESAGKVFKCTELEAVCATVDFSVQDDYKTVSANGFVDLTAGNALEAYIRCLDDDTDPQLISGQFTMQRIQ